MRSADSEPREWPGSHTVPAETLACWAPMNSMPAASSARATVALASSPKSSSGCCSGVTSETRTGSPARREQRGLVERQQPAGPRGCDERDAAHDPPPHLVAHLLERLGALGVAERDHAVEGGDRPRAGSEDQRVVGQRGAAVEHDAAPRGVDRGHGGRHEPAAQVGGDPAQRAADAPPRGRAAPPPTSVAARSRAPARRSSREHDRRRGLGARARTRARRCPLRRRGSQERRSGSRSCNRRYARARRLPSGEARRAVGRTTESETPR